MKDNENFDEIIEMQIDDADLNDLFDLNIDDAIISIAANKNCTSSSANPGGYINCRCCY